MHVSVTVCAGAINASYTISAMSAINVGSVLGAGHLLQFLTPDSSASSRYSISISSNVSMCSDTKLMGTTTKFCTPLSPSSGRTSSVYLKINHHENRYQRNDVRKRGMQKQNLMTTTTENLWSILRFF
ncbi:MAG: hypothetical protein ACI8RD_014259 [Bacillariaceae sp.]|jgi:hypothetical protein